MKRHDDNGDKTLWACLWFPQLPLNLAGRGDGQKATPLAISEQGRLTHVDGLARRQGVRPGMLPSAAYAMVPGLRILPRRRDREHQALVHIASCCYRYSDRVSLASADSILLEIAGSLRLFGSAAALLKRLRSDCALLGYRPQIGIAPWPAAASLFCRRRIYHRHAGPARRQLRQWPLKDLPAEVLEEGAFEALAASGLRCVGELQNLPRAALTQRINRHLGDYLERLTGYQPDPRPRLLPPETFSEIIEPPAPMADSQALLFVCQRLLNSLALFLAAQDRSVQQLRWCIHHERRDASHFAVSLQGPSREPQRWLVPLKEQLARWQLPDAAVAITLEARQLLDCQPPAADLFAGPDPAETRQRLLERLSSRARIRRLAVRSDHRPERRWCYQTALAPQPWSRRKPSTSKAIEQGDPGGSLPTWLLTSPQAIDPAELRLLDGPERIESGWWDKADCRRDYYLALARDGRYLWVYQQRRPPHDWYVHGLFE